MSVRGYVSFPFVGFGGGLNLRDKVDALQLSECIDCLDVTFTDRGAIEERAGYKAFTESALTNRVQSLEGFYTTTSNPQLLAGCGTRLEAISTSGTVVASATGLTNAVWDFARFGKPNEEVAYAGNGTDTLRKWTGSEWKAPAGLPKAGAICVDPTTNRLVAGGYKTTTGGPAGAESSPSHVYFSEAGNPESYEASAYVQFTPGDGERIQAVIAWREFVFVFKESRFFVVYSTSVDGEGKPIFNYRPIDTGVGLASPRAVCVHESGVYFMSRHGVYRTTGQEPEEVSQIIEPIWSGLASPFYTGGTLAQGSITECAMGTYEDRIYLSFPTGSATRVLLYDPQLDWWSIFDIPASCLTSFRISNAPELVFGYSTGENHIGRHSPSLTSDEGAAIGGFWRSGWFDLDNPDVKTIRDAKVWGSGIGEMGIDADFVVATGEGLELDMEGSSEALFGVGSGIFGGGDEVFGGSSPYELLPAYYGRDVRGTVFSVLFEGSTVDVPWAIHRAVFHLREVAKPDTVNV